MSSSGSLSAAAGVPRAAQVIVVSSVMFTFISFWRTAAVVLCDMSSTVYYIGAIVETAIGKAAPWFILGVLLFSYAMRAVYIESSALFVRGGVYRVVKQAMGGFLAKLSVSALLFDYVLTGPISAVSAGQYIVGLGLEIMGRLMDVAIDEADRQAIKSAGSVLIACGITLYFFRQNLLGIPESSGKALKIMAATTVMAAVLLIWCGATLAVRGPVNPVPPIEPDLQPKVTVNEEGETVPRISPATGRQEDPLGFIALVPWLADPLRDPASWWSIVGVIGIIIAFGHSILAMSGEETLAQVYREVQSPKLLNFKKAAFLVFAYSLLLTGTMNFLAVLLIPDDLRMGEYYDNWMGGLAMQVIGPVEVRLLLNALVVIVGCLILAGAANTSIIGCNGVLSRVAEDGVMPGWFLKPHPRYGTTYRNLCLIALLQMATILASRGDVILLGEAYAFGVVWSFVFKTTAMVMLRFKDQSPREFKVPLNVNLAGRELPVGLLLIAAVVLLSALANLFTKQVATVSGLIFTGAFLLVFLATETIYERRRRGGKHEHREQFNQRISEALSAEGLGLARPYRKLVAIRSPQNLHMLEKALAETDPDVTDVIVMTAKAMPPGGEAAPGALDLDAYDRQLMTAVVERAERAGKKVVPLIVPTNNPLHAILKTAADLRAQELIVGASNRFTAEEQLDQMALYWLTLSSTAKPMPLTIRIVGRHWDVHQDLGGGQRIPTLSERKARSVAELRAAGVGIDRVLLVHDGTREASDLFESVLTMLDPQVALALIQFVDGDTDSTTEGKATLLADAARARQLDRDVEVQTLHGDFVQQLVRAAEEGRFDLIIVGMPAGGLTKHEGRHARRIDSLLRQAPCRIFLASPRALPEELEPPPGSER